MTGRQGRVSTPEQARRKADAAVAREARKEAADSRPAVDLLEPVQRGALPEVAGASPLGSPISWREAWQQQQAAVAALRKRLLKIEVETAERTRLPVEDVQAFLGKLRFQMQRELSSLPGIAEGLPDARPQQLDWLRCEILKWIDKTKTTIAKMEIE